jgi:two-component system response regulator AtoC
VVLNCAALQETLVESELFGYEKGAFTGAAASKPGLLEIASGGTVFLDEVGDLSAAAQAKVLRALEVGRLTRLGDVRERDIDIRLVCATNRDLEAEVDAGRFRRDLYFRLSAGTVVLPPLRDRPREVPLLARRFLGAACAKLHRSEMIIAPAAMVALAAYDWPGNVRELKNAMEFVAAVLVEDQVEVWHLPGKLLGESERNDAGPWAGEAPRARPANGGAESFRADADRLGFRPVADELRELEKRRMREALDASVGVQRRAAELIGMPLRTFTMKFKQYGFRAPDDPKRKGF